MIQINDVLKMMLQMNDYTNEWWYKRMILHMNDNADEWWYR